MAFIWRSCLLFWSCLTAAAESQEEACFLLEWSLRSASVSQLNLGWLAVVFGSREPGRQKVPDEPRQARVGGTPNRVTSSHWALQHPTSSPAGVFCLLVTCEFPVSSWFPGSGLTLCSPWYCGRIPLPLFYCGRIPLCSFIIQYRDYLRHT